MGDETGYAVVKQLHGLLYVTACGGLKGGYDDDTLTAMAKIAKDQRVNYIVIESNFGDGLFTKVFSSVLQKIYPCTIEEIRHNTQKERRIIDTLEPVMNKHRLVFNSDVVREDLRVFKGDAEGYLSGESFRYSLFYQLTHLTKDRGSLKHDDRLDALAMAVAYWVESMGRDEDQAKSDYQDRMLDQELEKFMNESIFVSVKGTPSKGKTSSSRWY